jgi:hypothetical protein
MIQTSSRLLATTSPDAYALHSITMDNALLSLATMYSLLDVAEPHQAIGVRVS